MDPKPRGLTQPLYASLRFRGLVGGLICGGSLFGLTHLQCGGSWGLESPKGFLVTGLVPRLGCLEKLGTKDSDHDFSSWLAWFLIAGTVVTLEGSCPIGRGQWPLSFARFHVNMCSVWFHFLIFKKRLKTQIFLCEISWFLNIWS